jgi:hypothetical protein
MGKPQSDFKKKEVQKAPVSRIALCKTMIHNLQPFFAELKTIV